MTEREQFAHGYSVDCVEVYAGRTSLSCLTVQMNEDRDSFRSQIQRAENYPAERLKPILDIDQAIWAMWMSPAERYYAAASRVFISGPADNLVEIPLPLPTITRIWGLSDNEVYVLGDKGEVLRFDGRNWVDISIPDAGYLYRISGLRGNELYVSGSAGQLYRYDGRAWESIDTGTNADLYGVCATDPRNVIICGRGGYVAILSSDELVRIEGDPEKDYTTAARFKGEIFVGAGHKGLEKLEGQAVVPYKANVFSDNLSNTENYLCACGVNQIARFDGQGWLANRFD